MITASELQLLECLGVEPQLLDPSDPWCYNDAAYLVKLDDLSISFAVAPAMHDVRFIIHRGDQRIFELNAVDAADVRVLDEPGRDILEIKLDERSSLRVQFRPHFEMTQDLRHL